MTTVDLRYISPLSMLDNCRIALCPPFYDYDNCQICAMSPFLCPLCPPFYAL